MPEPLDYLTLRGQISSGSGIRRIVSERMLTAGKWFSSSGKLFFGFKDFKFPDPRFSTKEGIP